MYAVSISFRSAVASGLRFRWRMNLSVLSNTEVADAAPESQLQILAMQQVRRFAALTNQSN